MVCSVHEHTLFFSGSVGLCYRRLCLCNLGGSFFTKVSGVNYVPELIRRLVRKNSNSY